MLLTEVGCKVAITVIRFGYFFAALELWNLKQKVYSRGCMVVETPSNEYASLPVLLRQGTQLLSKHTI